MSLPRILLVLLAALPIAAAQEKTLPTYPDSDAAKHAGEEAVVTGKVVAVSKSAKGTTYLNFGDRFPRQTFSGMVLARDAENVGDMKTYEGKAVTVTGRIELSQDQKAQIVITAPTQIKLAEPGETPAPAPSPASAPMPAASSPPPPAPPVPPSPPKAAETRKIVLGANWNSRSQGGEMTRKDLALLLGGAGAASESVEGDPTVLLFGDVPFLAPLAAARKSLQLEGITPSVTKVTTPGLPLGSFSAHAFSGIFSGGYNRLYLITDNANQVVSILLVDETTRQRTSDVADSMGYHTYNFIGGRVKGTGELVVKHQLTTGAPRGVVVVESMLIDPNDSEVPAKSTTTTKTTKTARPPRTGKVMERSRWFVPVPVVNLILRCVGNR